MANASTTIVHKVRLLPTTGLLSPASEKQLLDSLTKAMERFVHNADLDECLSHYPEQAHLLRPYLEFWADFLDVPVRSSAVQGAADPAPAALFQLANVVAVGVLLVLVVVGLAALAGG